MNKYYWIFLLFLYGCSTFKENMTVNGSKNDAIMNAVLDFIHTEKNLLKEDKVFSTRTEEDINYISVSILGTDSPISFIIERDGSYSYRSFPTMLIETDGKLFFWRDKTKSVTDTIISTLYRYNFVDTVDMFILNITVRSNDAKKAAHYYFCKNNLSKYQKIITWVAMGSYEPPKLKCK